MLVVNPKLSHEIGITEGDSHEVTQFHRDNLRIHE